MGNHAAGKQNETRKLLAIASALVLAATLIASALGAQSAKGQTAAAQPPTPQWEIDAGGKMEFDVASVKRDTRPESPSHEDRRICRWVRRMLSLRREGCFP